MKKKVKRNPPVGQHWRTGQKTTQPSDIFCFKYTSLPKKFNRGES
jgi:hypothetical protein